MHPITRISIPAVAPYSGPGQIPGIRFRALREALEISSWGMNVLELDPNCNDYPEHDHKQDGQEEVYLVLAGSVLLQIGGDEWTLEEGDAVRVAPNLSRKLVTREHAARVLALGGTPGTPYSAG